MTDTTTPVPIPHMSSRQARLDAAIAHFRSEASASGYVVEEVRLRLPVPDIDVLPRVVIAQNAAAAAAASGGGGGNARFPHPKLPRLPTQESRPRNRLPGLGSLNTLADGAEVLSKDKGFKRTVSGSVILNAISPTTRGSQEPRGKFWNTVIAGEHRRESRKCEDSPASVGDGGGTGGRARDDGKFEAKKGRFRVGSHAIPDSHVQLLLSSVAEMPSRTLDTSVSSSASPTASPSPTGGTTVAASSVRASPNGASTPPKKSAYHRTGRSYGSRGVRGGEGRAARPFRCVQCPSSFDREGHLRVHILAVHEKKRPFVCQVCDSAFGHSSSLLRHVRTVHQARRESESTANNGGPFRCSACSTAFSRVAQLNRHVAANHPLNSAMPHTSARSPTESVASTEKSLIAPVKQRGDC